MIFYHVEWNGNDQKLSNQRFIYCGHGIQRLLNIVLVYLMSWNKNTTSNSLFIIKDCYGKFHHSISQIPLIIPNTIFRNFTLFFLSTLHKKLKRNTNLNQTEIKSWKMNNTNIQWNLWRVISLQLQHGGMSDGGGNIWASGCLPFFTMNAVSMPQVRWRSTWQCMNHTPATEKIYQHYT